MPQEFLCDPVLIILPLLKIEKYPLHYVLDRKFLPIP